MGMKCQSCELPALQGHGHCGFCILDLDSDHFSVTQAKTTCLPCRGLPKGTHGDYRRAAKVAPSLGYWPSRSEARKLTSPDLLGSPPSQGVGQQRPGAVPPSDAGIEGSPALSQVSRASQSVMQKVLQLHGFGTTPANQSPSTEVAEKFAGAPANVANPSLSSETARRFAGPSANQGDPGTFAGLPANPVDPREFAGRTLSTPRSSPVRRRTP